MIKLSTTPTNERKIDQLREAVAEALAETLRKGFYGTVGVTWNVNDGTIQEIHRHVERVRR
ncbi:MAG: hypothetical protein JW818_01845 [Pirellulales bacterium]|nr:hypothetical protein [Pirellulales bacterium]